MKRKWNRKKLFLLGSVFLALVVLVLIICDSRLKTVYYSVESDKLSAPVRFILLTDLHSCRYGENQKNLIETVQKFNPDIILLGGDIFDDKVPHKNAELTVKQLAEKYPCYYVTGNHEYWSREVGTILDIIESYGIIVLSGECDTVEIKGQTINICGVDDPDVAEYVQNGVPIEQQLVSTEKAARKAEETVEEEIFTVLLSHRPELYETYQNYDFDLVLSGHAHGGQWRIPGLLNGLYAPHQGLFPQYAGGRYDYIGGTMIVSRGLARESTPLPRIFNRPELVIVDIYGNKAEKVTEAPTQIPTAVPTQEPTPTPVPTAEPEPTPTELPKPTTSKRVNIPFTDNQMYAVAYLGYITIEDMDFYLENYLDEEDVPHYYFSGDEYYLIIPRYEDMEVRLYRNDLASMGKTLEQECEMGKPFIVQCNVSDIFPDVTVELTYNGETVEFSPYISLKDGSVQVGDRGLNITKAYLEDLVENDWVSLTEEELQWFNEQFFNTEGDVKRNDFLNCTYTNARSINIYEVFYNLSEEISPEERKALRGSEIDFGVDYQKLTAPYMDGILQEYMNISFEEIDKAGLDYYLYLEEFDAYYGSHGDTNYSRVEVKSGVKDEDGNVKLQYLRTEDGIEYIVTLNAYENGYYFVSNVEFE